MLQSQEQKTTCLNLYGKKHVTQVQQQRPESPTVPLVEFMYLVFTRIQVRVTVGDSGLCCWTNKLTPLCADSARALWGLVLFHIFESLLIETLSATKHLTWLEQDTMQMTIFQWALWHCHKKSQTATPLSTIPHVSLPFSVVPAALSLTCELYQEGLHWTTRHPSRSKVRWICLTSSCHHRSYCLYFRLHGRLYQNRWIYIYSLHRLQRQLREWARE